MTWTMTRTMRAGWPALLALMLAAGPTLAQDAGATDADEGVGLGTDGTTPDEALVDPILYTDYAPLPDEGEGASEEEIRGDAGLDGGMVGDDGELVDPILYTDYAPLPDEGVMNDGAIEGEPAVGDGGEFGGEDGVPTDSVCDGCEYETTGGVQNDAGPLAPAMVATRSRQGREMPVARVESGNICTSTEHYVAWLCEWQGFARP